MNDARNNDWIEQSAWLRFWVRFYPEIAFFKSREELRHARKLFRRRRASAVQLGVRVVTGMLLGGLIAGFGVRYLQNLGLSVAFSIFILMALCALVGVACGLLFWHRSYIRFVRRYLQDQGIGVCLKCGYDLGGQTVPRCPECATAFDASLLDGRPPESG